MHVIRLDPNLITCKFLLNQIVFNALKIQFYVTPQVPSGWVLVYFRVLVSRGQTHFQTNGLGSCLPVFLQVIRKWRFRIFKFNYTKVDVLDKKCFFLFIRARPIFDHNNQLLVSFLKHILYLWNNTAGSIWSKSSFSNSLYT